MRVTGATYVPGWGDCCTGGRAMPDAGCWGPALRGASPRPCPRGRYPPAEHLRPRAWPCPCCPQPSLGVPAGPSWGHSPAGSGTGRGGWGPTPPSPSELTPEPSSPQLLPFAGSVPRFAALSQPSAEIPTAGGGCGFAPQIRTHSAGPTASPGSGLGAFCSPFRSRRFNFGPNPFQHRAHLPAWLSAEISHP